MEQWRDRNRRWAEAHPWRIAVVAGILGGVITGTVWWLLYEPLVTALAAEALPDTPGLFSTVAFGTVMGFMYTIVYRHLIPYLTRYSDRRRK